MVVVKTTRALLTRLDGVRGSSKTQKAHSPLICTEVDECHIVELDLHFLSATLRIGGLLIRQTRRLMCESFISITTFGANKHVIVGGEEHLHSRTCEPATLARH